MEKAKNSSYYTFLAYENMKYRENLEKIKNKEFLIYKENIIKENYYPKKGYTYYSENIENVVQNFKDNSISRERLDNLLTMIQDEFVKSCKLSNEQLISLTKLINRNRVVVIK